MRIPERPQTRAEFLSDVIRRCMASQQERQALYRMLKQYYLFGNQTGVTSLQNVYGDINKIFPHIDKVGSIMYSGDTTRFSVEIAKSVPDAELAKVKPLSGAVNDVWHSSNTDIVFGEGLTWSYVYGSTYLKARPQRERIIPDIVLPHHFGVWREDQQGLQEQEAFVHEYYTPKSQLESDLMLIGTDVIRIREILEAASATEIQSETQATQPMDRLVTSAAYPAVNGEVNTAAGPEMSYIAKLPTPMVRMFETYIWDDAISDYRVFTMASPSVPIYDRPIERMFLRGEQPFVQICPYPLHNYHFGISLVERLVPLQDIRNLRWEQIQHMMELQARPPSYATGFQGDAGEIQDALDTANGLVNTPDQGAKVDKVQTAIPADLFSEITYIDGLFDEVSGTTQGMSGQGEPGVRSEGHASQLMRAGGSRVKKRALIVEDQLEEVATLFLKIMQKYSDETYRADSGEEFLAAQFTADFLVRVDAHSSSPVFMQDMTQLAIALYKLKAIDREELIDMLGLPMKELLKRTLRTKIEPAEAAERKAELAAIAKGENIKKFGKR